MQHMYVLLHALWDFASLQAGLDSDHQLQAAGQLPLKSGTPKVLWFYVWLCVCCLYLPFIVGNLIKAQLIFRLNVQPLIPPTSGYWAPPTVTSTWQRTKVWLSLLSDTPICDHLGTFIHVFSKSAIMKLCVSAAILSTQSNICIYIYMYIFICIYVCMSVLYWIVLYCNVM